MKNFKIILIALIALGMTSCRTIRTSTASTADVQTSVIQYPTVTDLTVMKKAEKTITWNFNPFKRENLSLQKTNLMADLLKELDADILLEPQYTFKKVPFGERTLSITGYPAKFKDFRKATEEDLKALQVFFEKPHESTIYNIAQPAKKHERRFLGIF